MRLTWSLRISQLEPRRNELPLKVLDENVQRQQECSELVSTKARYGGQGISCRTEKLACPPSSRRSRATVHEHRQYATQSSSKSP